MVRIVAADTQLIALTAEQAVDLLVGGQVSPLDLVDAAAARIEATDGAINAMPTLCLDRARDHARRITRAQRPGSGSPWLGGLPIAVKDLNDVDGVRTTYGSIIYADHVPSRSDLMVERLEERGAIVIGKSNTPEFGAGGNTFNEVFGETRNPWNPALTPGGSSGGSAAALAPDRSGWQPAPISAGACARRRASAPSSACVPAQAGSPAAPGNDHSTPSRSRAPWDGPSVTSR